ncbi:MAG: hypothetical protein HKO59_15715 [Phycisphaerales bacterium]|nr:hypothetical protein [Phycisphaerales bacterium]NNM27402.1 hypothetical protein [Phycisphaerales bacterium]
MLSRRCECGGRSVETPGRKGSRLAGVMLVFVLTAAIIIGGALAVAAARGPGYGVAVAVGAWFLLHLSRLGYDLEDGIDVRQLILPSPLDWHIKLESLVNFWTSPRAYFRAAYLAGFAALVVVLIVLVPDLRGH